MTFKDYWAAEQRDCRIFPSYILVLCASNLCSPSARRTLLEESTECSTEGEVTCSRRPRPPAHPCSWWRPICPSTSHSGSPPTWDPTLEARPSLSVCLTTGRSCPEIPCRRAPNPTPSWRTPRRGRDWNPATQTFLTIWTNCNQEIENLLCIVSLLCLDYNYLKERLFFILFMCRATRLSIWSV